MRPSTCWTLSIPGTRVRFRRFHANSASQALSRLASLALRANVDLPYRAIQSAIGDLVNVVVHIERRDGTRFVSEVLHLHGYDVDSSSYNTSIEYQS